MICILLHSFTFSSIICFNLVLLLTILVQNLLHFFNSIGVLFLKDLFSSVSDFFFKHFLFIFQQEFKPATFTLILDFNWGTHLQVGISVFLFNEVHEVLCSVLELTFPSGSFQELPEIFEEYTNDTDDNQIKQCELDH